jgi:hypothetical protein
MIVIILGIIDLLAAGVLFSLNFTTALIPLAWILTLILAVKSLMFLKSFASVIDLLVVIVFVFAILGITNVLTALGILWLIQKGIVSFF